MQKINVGAKLKELRESRNMTQFELADKAGINRVTVARYEIGDIGMSLVNATKIADALGCKVDDLIKEESA